MEQIKKHYDLIIGWVKQLKPQLNPRDGHKIVAPVIDKVVKNSRSSANINNHNRNIFKNMSNATKYTVQNGTSKINLNVSTKRTTRQQLNLIKLKAPSGGMVFLPNILNMNEQRLNHADIKNKITQYILDPINRTLYPTNTNSHYEIVGFFVRGADGAQYKIKQRNGSKMYLLKVGRVTDKELQIATNQTLIKQNIIPKCKCAYKLINYFAPNMHMYGGYIQEFTGVPLGNAYVWTQNNSPRVRRTFSLDLAELKTLLYKLYMFQKVTNCFHGDFHYNNILVINENGKKDFRIIDFGRSFSCTLQGLPNYALKQLSNVRNIRNMANHLNNIHRRSANNFQKQFPIVNTDPHLLGEYRRRKDGQPWVLGNFIQAKGLANISTRKSSPRFRPY